MKREDLESINSELFAELDLAEQQFIVGQLTHQDTWTWTAATKQTDFNGDYQLDWS